ncbi:type I-E CRISPR-associated protein Cas7/Cse4/CasC [Micrococcus luteus]
MSKKFIEVHVLQWFPFSCINRDDAGLPKSMTLGGERRARWSSQSQKRALRLAMTKNMDAENLATRTRRLPIQTLETLIGRGRDSAESAARVVAAFWALGLNLNTVQEAKKDAKDTGEALAAQEGIEGAPAFGAVLTGRTQVILPAPKAGAAYLADAIEKHWDVLGGVVNLALVKDGKAEKKVAAAVVKETSSDLRRGIDAARQADVALFGRMLTEVPDGGTVEAAASVAHAFTTHPDDYTTEFWSAVDDDAAAQGHGGSANMGTQGYTSGAFYRYGVLDVDTLAEGPLNGEDDLVQAAAGAFVEQFASLLPTAMVHGTAPFVAPAYVVARVSDAQRMLGDAFIRPVEPEEGDYLSASATRMATVASRSYAAYGNDGDAAYVLAAHPDVQGIEFPGATEVDTLTDLVDHVKEAAFRV